MVPSRLERAGSYYRQSSLSTDMLCRLASSLCSNHKLLCFQRPCALSPDPAAAMGGVGQLIADEKTDFMNRTLYTLTLITAVATPLMFLTGHFSMSFKDMDLVRGGAVGVREGGAKGRLSRRVTAVRVCQERLVGGAQLIS